MPKLLKAWAILLPVGMSCISIIASYIVSDILMYSQWCLEDTRDTYNSESIATTHKNTNTSGVL